MIIGFAWGGWTTFGTSQTRTSEAVLAGKRQQSRNHLTTTTTMYREMEMQF
jgi:hypothetical protein